MDKRNYTHVQELFPEIEAMLASGKTLRKEEGRCGVAQTAQKEPLSKNIEF